VDVNRSGMGGYGLDRCGVGCCDQGNVRDQQNTQRLHVTAAALTF